ncbi:MAG: hypothetical protein FDZ69_04565 [Deltaproteobacteria bacterium]|nr:MAG: hypothetical protein FDZ69_04565 [Deltaproteobacteria bacterium]
MDIENIRKELDNIQNLSTIEDKAKTLASCLHKIKEIMEYVDLSERDIKLLNNLRISYLRNFVDQLKKYGNSGYSEALPLMNLLLENADIIAQLDEIDPGLTSDLRRFFRCID